MVQLTSTLQCPQCQPSLSGGDRVGPLLRLSRASGERDHLTKPAELAVLASVEFVVKEADTAAAPGADFLVKRSDPSGVDEPLIEAVMLGSE